MNTKLLNIEEMAPSWGAETEEMWLNYQVKKVRAHPRVWLQEYLNTLKWRHRGFNGAEMSDVQRMRIKIHAERLLLENLKSNRKYGLVA